jgi:hypothetical protein
MSFDASSALELVKCCLSSLMYCAHIASHCYCDDALLTLVTTFTKFTRLRTYIEGDVKPKNIVCRRYLLRVATEDRNYLRGVWSIVMDEVSAVDKSKYFSVPDSLFTASDTLDRESIKDYSRAICQTAAQELQETPHRMFMLLRLADVAYFNMERPKIIWQEIWEIISEFLIVVASAEDGKDEVLQGTVNVLWQIARKFIARPETDTFHFQQHFMRPFFEIFIAQPSPIIREFIVNCLACLVSEFSNTLHSGWYVVFQILTQASDGFRPKGYRLLATIIQNHFRSLSRSHVFHLISVGMSFVMKGKEAKLACKCVILFMKIAKQLDASEAQIESWDCLYASLEKCITHPLVEVKKKAVLTGIAMAKESNMAPQFRKRVFMETLPRFLDMLSDPGLADFVAEWRRKVAQWGATKC